MIPARSHSIFPKAAFLLGICLMVLGTETAPGPEIRAAKRAQIERHMSALAKRLNRMPEIPRMKQPLPATFGMDLKIERPRTDNAN